jgi:multiple antibiotic resistance protein
MREFWLCFVPMFVAVDALGVLPFFFSITERLSNQERGRIVRQSVITAALVAMAFLFGGNALLKALGVTVPDFMVAGGTLLFIIALRDVLGGPKTRRTSDASSMGAVPIGVPLITGPAVLTTEVLLSNEHGASMTAVAVLLNIALAGLVFGFSDRIHRILGRNGAKALSKIAALILASIAVMMIRKGVMQIVAGAGDAVKQL